MNRRPDMNAKRDQVVHLVANENRTLREAAQAVKVPESTAQGMLRRVKIDACDLAARSGRDAAAEAWKIKPSTLSAWMREAANHSGASAHERAALNSERDTLNSAFNKLQDEQKRLRGDWRLLREQQGQCRIDRESLNKRQKQMDERQKLMDARQELMDARQKELDENQRQLQEQWTLLWQQWQSFLKEGSPPQRPPPQGLPDPGTNSR